MVAFPTIGAAELFLALLSFGCLTAGVGAGVETTGLGTGFGKAVVWVLIEVSAFACCLGAAGLPLDDVEGVSGLA